MSLKQALINASNKLFRLKMMENACPIEVLNAKKEFESLLLLKHLIQGEAIQK